MAGMLGQDSSTDRANRMAAIRHRRSQGKPSDPNCGSHLPPPPPPKGSQPRPAEAPTGPGADQDPRNPQHGRRAQQAQPGMGSSDPPSPTGPMGQGQQQGQGGPVYEQQQQHQQRVQFVPAPPGGGGYGYGYGPGVSPRIEAQPLGLSQIFGSGNYRSGSSSGRGGNGHTDPSLINEMMSEGRGPTAKANSDLVKCADNVSTQPDALDAFLRKYALSGGGHMPSPRGDGAPSGGIISTYPPLRIHDGSPPPQQQHPVQQGAGPRKLPMLELRGQPSDLIGSDMLLADSTFVKPKNPIKVYQL